MRGPFLEALKVFTHQELLKSDLKDLRLVKVFLLITGRNAWHSTWSTRYSRQRAIFSSFEEAKNVAENIRIQGSQFTIREIPALAFYSLSGIIVICEFHSRPQYSNLKLDRIAEALRLNNKLVKAIQPFRATSDDFWTKPFPDSDSFIVSVVPLSQKLNLLPEQRDLKSWKSSSSGPRYYLHWNQVGARQIEPLERIIEIFKEVNEISSLLESEFNLELAINKEYEINSKKNHQEALAENLVQMIDEWFEQNGISNPNANSDDEE